MLIVMYRSQLFFAGHPTFPAYQLKSCPLYDIIKKMSNMFFNYKNNFFLRPVLT